jgi:glycosyltransferase involved in cell wall biosynthesis
MQSASVAILLCTYNGGRFLPAQLHSYETQEFEDWVLFVSDDGSQDETLPILERFQRKHGEQKVQIRHASCRGFAANFLTLICDPALKSDYYALSDQDDIWLPHKLSLAQSYLRNNGDDLLVYCSRTRVIDEEGHEIGLSPLFTKSPNFRNALVQNIAGGNTMAFNDKVRQMLIQAGPNVNIVSHDWWVYLLTTAVGGTVYYDRRPSLCYRVHSGNVIGSNRSLDAQIVRARMLMRGRFKSWIDINVSALERIEDRMTDENRKSFELFRRSRKLSLVPRAYGLVRSGIHRQTFLGNLGIGAAALIGML